MNYEDYMRRALELAAFGAGWASPNPQVGCVLVKDNEIIGEGWHRRRGDLHAEREALLDCANRGNDPRGATAFVTLEPCCHHGKQPPCTDALIEAGIARVVMGAFDPNPKVAGKGIQLLREAGIEVVEGVCTKECEEINKEWLHFITENKPYVTMKYAMTLDGKINTCTGDSKWVTGPEARRRVHEDRAKAAAVMVGIGTVLADDPLLTARIDSRTPGGVHQPIRVVLDAQARTPLESQLALTAYDSEVIVVTEPDAPYSRVEALKDAGCKVWSVPCREGKLDLKQVVSDLYEKRECVDIIVEGGGELHGSLLGSGLVNRVQAYVAPKVIGGRNASSPVEGAGIPIMDMALPLHDVTVTQLGEDFLIEGEVG